jgi:hypothetical protein
MYARRKLLPLSCSLLLSAIGAGEATAQTPQFIEYAAKFACGRVPLVQGGGDADVVAGVYASSINIHNPQAEAPVTFAKKIVVANPEGQPFGHIVVKQDTIPPGQAERVDCPLIFKLLDASAGRHVEGFVVLEVKKTEPQLFLDVVGKYSARAANGEVSSFDVVPYSQKEISR